MFEVQEGNRIRYWDLAPKIFPGSGMQEMIPFVGAGVSVSARTGASPRVEPQFPAPDVMSQVLDLLGITENQTRLYLEYAIRSALWMQAYDRSSGPPPSRDEFLNGLRRAEYPPFAWELSEMFSRLSAYRMLEDTALRAARERQLLPDAAVGPSGDTALQVVQLLSQATRLGSPTDPLTSISSYYEAGSERADVWRNLYGLFQNKRLPTETHRLIALAAREHLRNNPYEDYLVITTNYDCLIEAAMEELGVPYAVLRPNRKDGKIYCRFANLDSGEVKRLERLNPAAEPDKLTLKKGSRILAVIYKIHGDLHPDLTADDDGLVLTDADYVDFISRASRIIPAHAGSILPHKRLMFLGYSFSDWNIRSIYETMMGRKHGAEQDYAVTLAISKFEETYFRKRNIIVILSGLNEFTAGIRGEAGTPAA